LKESHILFNSWLVHLVADHLEKFSEGLLISLTGLPLSELEIDFSQVHSDRSWSESFEKFGNEVDRKAVAFGSSCRFELFRVNGVDIE
jgi:hypothetical protein